MSYSNVIMLGAVLPSYDTKKDSNGKSQGNQKTINAEDPANKAEVDKLFESSE